MILQSPELLLPMATAIHAEVSQINYMTPEITPQQNSSEFPATTTNSSTTLSHAVLHMLVEVPPP